jgi:hypothetical protein
MRLTPCEYQQAVDFVLVPALPNSANENTGQGHRITAGDTVHVSKAVTDKSSLRAQIGGLEKDTAARRIGLTQ